MSIWIVTVGLLTKPRSQHARQRLFSSSVSPSRSLRRLRRSNGAVGTSSGNEGISWKINWSGFSPLLYVCPDMAFR